MHTKEPRATKFALPQQQIDIFIEEFIKLEGIDRLMTIATLTEGTLLVRRAQCLIQLVGLLHSDYILLHDLLERGGVRALEARQRAKNVS